jgi:hypothetical protein
MKETKFKEISCKQICGVYVGRRNRISICYDLVVLHVSTALTYQNYILVLHTECICVFRTLLAANSDNFSTQP